LEEQIKSSKRLCKQLREELEFTKNKSIGNANMQSFKNVLSEKELNIIALTQNLKND